jgi:hypothetical protein
MEGQMLQAHKTKFTENYDTHSLLEPLASILGPDGLTQSSELILTGQYKFPPCIHPDVFEFFSHIKMPNTIRSKQPVTSNMPPNYYKYYWKPSR